MLEHSRACLHQPRVPSTGSRQATDLSIKWQEVRNVTCLLRDSRVFFPWLVCSEASRPMYLLCQMRQVLAQKENVLRILSFHTGHSPSKLDKVTTKCTARGGLSQFPIVQLTPMTLVNRAGHEATVVYVPSGCH